MADRTILARGQTLTDGGAGQWVVLEIVGTLGATALVRLQPADAPESPALDDTPTRPLPPRRTN